MEVQNRSIDTITPYPNNPRHNDSAVEAVVKSIQEFGFRQPIVVDKDGVIVVGHTRFKAARKLGMLEVPVHVAEGLTPAQLQCYRIADNQTATIATWDDDKLTQELLDLQKQDYSLDLTGFDNEDLTRLIGNVTEDGNTDPDVIPEPPDKATTVKGDLWILGEHRLLCGDSSKPEDLDYLLREQRIHLVNTDPPYGVKVEPRSNNAIAAGLSSFEAMNHQKLDVERHPEKAQATHTKLRPKDRPLANDFLSEEDFARLLEAWFANIARVLVPGGGFYIWGGYANLANYPPALRSNELYFSQAIVWDKQHPVLTRKDMMGSFELAFYGWREGAAHRFFGPNNATDLWHIKKVTPQSMIHLTEKPVELATRALEYSSLLGENVLDLFGGSGSTLMAAEQLGRKAFLMEIDELYCDVIVQRWEAFTGKKAERVQAAG